MKLTYHTQCYQETETPLVFVYFWGCFSLSELQNLSLTIEGPPVLDVMQFTMLVTSHTQNSHLSLCPLQLLPSPLTLLLSTACCPFSVWPITTSYLIPPALSLASHFWNHLELVLRKCIQAQTCNFYLFIYLFSISLHEEFME